MTDPPRRSARSRKPVSQEPAVVPAVAPAKKKPKTTKAKTPPGTPNRQKKKPSTKAAAAAPAVVTPPRKSKSDGDETKKKSSHPVDEEIRIKGQNPADYTVYQDAGGLWYDSVLNQCNIGHNNNKYYRLQILQSNSGSGAFYTWFKWGRVGEPGKNGSSTWQGPSSIQEAKKVFGKKYRDKTKNGFGAQSFVEYTGKYVPVEIDNDVEVGDDFMTNPGASKEEAPCMKSALDPTTQELIQVLFSREMQSQALLEFSIDLKKLPLGVPSKDQIQRGIDVLQQIEDKLDNKGNVSESYMTLSSKFYTAIPHAFGRRVPPTISTKVDLQTRYDICNILLDMYDTNETVRKIAKDTKKEEQELQPNPIDQHYNSLNADLTLLDTSSSVFKDIKEYFEKTKNSGSKGQLINAWSVDRKGEEERFARFDNVGNRRLLWHGTNIAVVAPILTSGLRIMPHSGGRVGAGIYLANLQQKSAQYTSGYGSKFACMFLCEAPLGKQHIVDKDGPHASQLKKAPEGCDSVQAVGSVAPKKSKSITIDGKSVELAPSPPVPSGKDSSFHHDEFLVYEEAQVRIRFVLTVKLH